MFDTFKSPYVPRKHPAATAAAVCCQLVLAITLTIILTWIAVPIYRGNQVAGPQEIWDDYILIDMAPQVHARAIALLLSFIAGGLVAGRMTWKNSPRREIFTQLDDTEPHVFYDDDARRKLQARLFKQYGPKARQGLYLAPHLAMPRDAETKNFLIVGAQGSGKSNLIRALSDQIILRKDRAVLLCNKGDIASSFLPSEAILIGAHHARSYAWDLAADVEGAAGAQQFAADIIPRSNPPFWSNSARAVLTDIISDVIYNKGQLWTARDIIQAAFADTDVIREALAAIDLSASPLLESKDADGDDRTVSGILLTMRSAVLVHLRPLAWAWDSVPEKRRFSINRWLDTDYKGRRTVILQFSPLFEEVSTLVIGGILKRVARQLSDPATAIDPARRVFLVLDEFNILPRIEGLGKALQVGREKGFGLVVGLQSISQMIATYGEHQANVLMDLFQVRIFGQLLPGDATDRVSRMLGTRITRALVENATPAAGDTRPEIAVDKEIPTFGKTRLEGELGVFTNETETGDVHALVHAYGQAFVLKWPFTTWAVRNDGYVIARWAEEVLRFKKDADPDTSDDW